MLPSANPSVIFQQLEDGAVLFLPASELYFGLNTVGALIWTLLPPRTETLDAICASVATTYPGVPTNTVRSDVEELLEQLIAEGLAFHTPPRGTDAAATA